MRRRLNSLLLGVRARRVEHPIDHECHVSDESQIVHGRLVLPFLRVRAHIRDEYLLRLPRSSAANSRVVCGAEGMAPPLAR